LGLPNSLFPSRFPTNTLCIPLPLYNIFPNYFTNGRIFLKKVIEYKIIFDFLYNFFQKYFPL
jgi:hypothetical protein